MALDPRLADWVVAAGRSERLWTGGVWTEGPVGFDERGYLVWSDIPNNRILRQLAESSCKEPDQSCAFAPGLDAEILRLGPKGAPPKWSGRMVASDLTVARI